MCLETTYVHQDDELVLEETHDAVLKDVLAHTLKKRLISAFMARFKKLSNCVDGGERVIHQYNVAICVHGAGKRQSASHQYTYSLQGIGIPSPLSARECDTALTDLSLIAGRHTLDVVCTWQSLDVARS